MAGNLSSQNVNNTNFSSQRVQNFNQRDEQTAKHPRESSTKNNDITITQENKSIVNNNKTLIKGNALSPSKSPIKSRVKKTDNKTNKKVVIIGDSILNGIQENGISNNTTNVKIRNHPGATSEDMCDFIKPESRKNPNIIIVHVGTNELKDNKKTLENFKKMNDTVKAKTPMCKFVISDVVIRKDKPEMEKKVK